MEHHSETNPPISIWPIILAGALTLMIAGVVTNIIVSIVGTIVLLVGIVGWAQETRIFGMEEADEGAAEDEHE